MSNKRLRDIIRKICCTWGAFHYWDLMKEMLTLNIYWIMVFVSTSIDSMTAKAGWTWMMARAGVCL